MPRREFLKMLEALALIDPALRERESSICRFVIDSELSSTAMSATGRPLYVRVRLQRQRSVTRR